MKHYCNSAKTSNKRRDCLCQEGFIFCIPIHNESILTMLVLVYSENNMGGTNVNLEAAAAGSPAPQTRVVTCETPFK